MALNSQPASAKDTAGAPFIPQPAPLSPFGSVFTDSVPAAEWDLNDVGDWLESLGCGMYRKRFDENHIAGDILLELGRSDLRELVEKVGDRLRILQGVKRLQFISEAAATARAATAAAPQPSSIESTPRSAGYFSAVDTFSSDCYDQDSLRFVYPDGTTRFISVANVRTATEIKLSAIRRIIPAISETALVNWTITDAESRPVTDNELMARARTPSPTTTLFVRHSPVSQLHSPRRTSTATLRSVVQVGRPTSQQVSENIEEYFPGVDREELQATIRNSVLVSRRLSTVRNSSRISRRISNLVVPARIDATPSAPSAPAAPSIAPPGTTTPMRRPTATSRHSLATLSKRFSSLNPLSKAPESDAERGDESDEATLKGPPPVTEQEGIAELDLGDHMDADWFRGKVIGSGSFGTVFMGVNKVTGELIAVKEVLLPTGNSVDEQRSRKMVDALKREINFMKEFDHGNIVQYLGFQANSDSLHIFLEYVPGGSLHSILNQTGPFENTLVKRYSRQILAGLRYLHERNIIHRDIKGANVLVDNRGIIKISDFGLSKKAETQKLLANRQSMQGSAFWMAPEVVRQHGAATVKADIWSFGCLLIELFTGTHPFPKLSQVQAIFQLGTHVKPEIPKDLTPDAEDFLMKTLTIDFNSRPTAQELSTHEFLK